LIAAPPSSDRVNGDDSDSDQVDLDADDPNPAVADVDALSLEVGRRLPTRLAGVFLFWPLLARLQFDRLVAKADYPGSKMIPATQALLSLLTLKLLDKERRSHIDDFNCDEALGLFAGLNVLPKKSFATDYSYRTQRCHQERLLQGWVKRLAPHLFPEASSFSVDFHAIPYRGEEAVLDNHYLPRRGLAGPSILAFFAQERRSGVLCYANTNLTRATQSQVLDDFVRFWRDTMGRDPEWLYFDSKLVTYADLSRVNEQRISFVTIRRRGAGLVRRLRSLPASQWRHATIDIPKRRHQQIQYVDERVSLRDYAGQVRQIAVTGLGREAPTLFLTNHFKASPRDIVMNYARRNGVEDALGTSVNFFHLDCLSSEVRLNVDLDAMLTVIAHGCYRWLATRLKGFDKAKPKQLYRKFVETSGAVEVISPGRLMVQFDRRAHNPILREAAMDRDCPPIPWLPHHRVEFAYS